MMSISLQRRFRSLSNACLYSSATEKSLFITSYKSFVDGKQAPLSTKDEFNVYAPATGAQLCGVQNADVGLVNDAISNCHATFESGIWSRADVRERAKVLQRIADNLRKEIPRLAKLEVAQTGRPIREMNAQLARLPEWFEYFGAVIRTQEGTVPPFLGSYINYVRRVPLGVCGLLTPWNHPMLIAIKKIAPAIATGNSIIVKPSEFAPVSVVELARICSESGLPNGVMNVVTALGPEAGQAICSHPLVKRIDLTGGTPTGRKVGAAAGANLASITSELGGKAAMVIFNDCDLQQAVNGAAFATFVASGQTCIMGARLIIHKDIYAKFMELLVAKVTQIRLGDPFDVDTQMGPVISGASKRRIADMVETARQQGAVVLAGGGLPTMPAPFDKGHYYSPTVLEVTPSMSIWRDEVFGPVVVAVSFDSEEEAVRLSNDSPFGLAAAVWTKDVMRAHRVADKLDVGIVWINDHHRNDPSSPWGGMKDSGIGRENGYSAFMEYTQAKSVIVRTDNSPFDWFEQKDARYG